MHLRFLRCTFHLVFYTFENDIWYNWACIEYLKCVSLCGSFLARAFTKEIWNFGLSLSSIRFSAWSRWNNCHFFNFGWYFIYDRLWRRQWCLLLLLLFCMEMSSAGDFDWVVIFSTRISSKTLLKKSFKILWNFFIRSTT